MTRCPGEGDELVGQLVKVVDGIKMTMAMTRGKPPRATEVTTTWTELNQYLTAHTNTR